MLHLLVKYLLEKIYAINAIIHPASIQNIFSLEPKKIMSRIWMRKEGVDLCFPKTIQQQN